MADGFALPILGSEVSERGLPGPCDFNIRAASRILASTPSPALRFYEHAVAVGIETVTVGYSVGVRIQHILFPTESTDQHQQSGLRKVEVREKRVYYAEFIAGIDEEIGLSRSGLNITRLPRSILESSNRRCADSYYTTFLAACTVNLFGSLFENRVGLGVQLVLFDFFHVHWLEGSESHVERYLCRFEAAFVQAGENLQGEMKAGGRSGD